MAMWDWGDLAGMLTAVRGENEQTITIRRGGTTLAPQPVRIARVGGQGRQRESDGAESSYGRVVVLGGVDFDVQRDDRFNDAAGVLYTVVLVRPNRRAAVVAEAEVVQ